MTTKVLKIRGKKSEDDYLVTVLYIVGTIKFDVPAANITAKKTP